MRASVRGIPTRAEFMLENMLRTDSRLAFSQWETSLQSNGVSHWLAANPVGWAVPFHAVTCFNVVHRTLPYFRQISSIAEELAISAGIPQTWARFLSLARNKLRLSSANHWAGYFSNLACDWQSIVWAYSRQETGNGSWLIPVTANWLIDYFITLWPLADSSICMVSNTAPSRADPEVVFTDTLALANGAHHKKPCWWCSPQETLLMVLTTRNLADDAHHKKPCWWCSPQETLLMVPTTRNLADGAQRKKPCWWCSPQDTLADGAHHKKPCWWCPQQETMLMVTTTRNLADGAHHQKPCRWHLPQETLLMVLTTRYLADGAHHKKPCWWCPPQETLLMVPTTRNLADVAHYKKPCWWCPLQETLLMVPTTRDLADGAHHKKPCRWCPTQETLLMVPTTRNLADGAHHKKPCWWCPPQETLLMVLTTRNLTDGAPANRNCPKVWKCSGLFWLNLIGLCPAIWVKKGPQLPYCQRYTDDKGTGRMGALDKTWQHHWGSTQGSFCVCAQPMRHDITL